jgi:hypothetical protein
VSSAREIAPAWQFKAEPREGSLICVLFKSSEVALLVTADYGHIWVQILVSFQKVMASDMAVSAMTMHGWASFQGMTSLAVAERIDTKGLSVFDGHVSGPSNNCV